MNPQRVTEIRTALGWTKKRLAKELRVAPSTVFRWEHGHMPMREFFERELERVAQEGEPEACLTPEQVREIRQQAGYIGLVGAKSLALELNVHFRTIYHWEEGHARPSKAIQEKLEELSRKGAVR